MMNMLRLMLLLLLAVDLHAAEIGFGTYGNWCGLNHPSDPNTAAAPIDALDSLCQRHDQCYVDKGQFSCDCDAAFQSELSSALKQNQYQGDAKHFARTAHHYFKGSPCTGTPKSKTGPTKAIQNLLNKGKQVVGKIMPSDNETNLANPTTPENKNADIPITTAPSASDTPSEVKPVSPEQDDSQPSE